MTQQEPPPPPRGQGPIDPTGVFAPVPPPGAARGPGFGGAQGFPPPPPPGMFPPPFFYPPPPPPRKRVSFFDIIGIAVTTVLFMGSLAVNVILLVMVASQSDLERIKVRTLVEGDSSQKIAVVDVSGLIMSRQADRFVRLLNQIEKDATVKALVVCIDSPGGSVSASDEMHHRLSQFKTETGRKVVVSMQDMAASGGYYLAVAGDFIMAEPTTITGSIGVMMPHYDLTEFGDKYGIHDDTLHSTGADFKNTGSMFKKDTAEQRAYLTNLIDQMFKQFKDIVVAGRKSAKVPLAGDINKIANGKAYTSQEALSFGLIDAAAYSDDAWKQAATMAGLSGKYSVVKYEFQESLLDMLSSESKLSLPRGVVNGLNVNVNQDLVRES